MGTIWIEFTKWRGLATDRTLFGPVLRLGWIGIGISRFALTVWVHAWHSLIEKVQK
jgi:hypothetical protein